ncbi:MAG TPA: hypothetical protein VGC45_15665 [Gryllotalpicola sp.]
MADWMQDPEAQVWAKHVIDGLAPMIADSVVTVSIAPSTPDDVKFAVELGLSIMLDKPIILAVPAGRQVPDHLMRVADEILELGEDGFTREQAALIQHLAQKHADRR